MGADIHITVGRINQKQLTGPGEVSSGTELALFNNRRLHFGDFEFESSIPKEVEIHQNYDLFSFLAGIRGFVKPIMPLDKLKEATREFIRWINSEYIEAERQECAGTWFSYDSELLGSYARYRIGDHSRVFYPIQVLTSFDYDQVVELDNEDSDPENPTYHRDPKGQSYREYLCSQRYFDFLDWCVKGNWQFVIFGFDS